MSCSFIVEAASLWIQCEHIIILLDTAVKYIARKQIAIFVVVIQAQPFHQNATQIPFAGAYEQTDQSNQFLDCQIFCNRKLVNSKLQAVTVLENMNGMYCAANTRA